MCKHLTTVLAVTGSVSFTDQGPTDDISEEVICLACGEAISNLPVVSEEVDLTALFVPDYMPFERILA